MNMNMKWIVLFLGICGYGYSKELNIDDNPFKTIKEHVLGLISAECGGSEENEKLVKQYADDIKPDLDKAMKAFDVLADAEVKQTSTGVIRKAQTAKIRKALKGNDSLLSTVRDWTQIISDAVYMFYIISDDGEIYTKILPEVMVVFGIYKIVINYAIMKTVCKMEDKMVEGEDAVKELYEKYFSDSGKGKRSKSKKRKH